MGRSVSRDHNTGSLCGSRVGVPRVYQWMSAIVARPYKPHARPPARPQPSSTLNTPTSLQHTMQAILPILITHLLKTHERFSRRFRGQILSCAEDLVSPPRPRLSCACWLCRQAGFTMLKWPYQGSKSSFRRDRAEETDPKPNDRNS